AMGLSAGHVPGARATGLNGVLSITQTTCLTPICSGVPGSLVNISAIAGTFAGGSILTAQFRDSNNNTPTMSLGSSQVLSQSDGSLSLANITLPLQATYGQATISITDATGNNKASGQFNITPKVSTNGVTSAPPGASVQVSGDGFHPGATMSF